MNMMNQTSFQPEWIRNKQDRLESVRPELANYRFDEWNDRAKQHLSTQGFVVIKNILTTEEINHSKVLLWNFLNELGWKRQDPSTWNTDIINPKGIVWGNGAGQSKLQWFIRSRPKVVNTFANMWSSQDIYAKQGIKFDYKKDIITSMDGFSVFRPWYLNSNIVPNAEKWKTQSGWYHIDQNIKRKPEIETIQGIVSLYDQDKSTGSTVFIPGSHNWVSNLLPNLSPFKNDFVMIPKKKLDRLNKKKILLCCKAGDLVMWDSRCIHCNSPAILSKTEMRRTHAMKLKQKMGSVFNNSKSISKENDEEKKQEPNNLNTKMQNMTFNTGNMGKTEKHFIESMKGNYLKAKINRNLNGMKDMINYNGYICKVILWANFDEKYFTNGKNYLFCLPWNTSILWIPQWLDRITGNNLKKLILEKIKFETPTLRFDKKNKHGDIIGVKEIKQNRNTAWISNDCNQSIQNRDDTDVLPAIKLEEWSNDLLKHACNTASNGFNAMLMIHYLDGTNSIGLHADNDDGLGSNASIGSLSLGSKRTFFIKSKEYDAVTGKKIEFNIPLVHGSFIVMNAGFQNHWLHSIPKERHVMGDRINVTFRKYELAKDKLSSSDNKENKEDIDVDAINVPSLLRAASYICMVPKIKVKDIGVIRQRIAAYETWSTCSHWPQKCSILYKAANRKEQSIENVKHNKLIQSLIGVDMLKDEKKYNHKQSQQNQNNDNNSRFKKKNKRKRNRNGKKKHNQLNDS